MGAGRGTQQRHRRRRSRHAALADSAGEAAEAVLAHPTLSFEEIRVGTQGAWDRFYSWPNVWARSRVVKSLKARLAFVLISKLYRQMYANTGIATDSARVARSARWARWMGRATRRLFIAPPMPGLQVPQMEGEGRS